MKPISIILSNLVAIQTGFDVVRVIGSSPTNPTSEESLEVSRLFSFLEALGWAMEWAFSSIGATMISEKSYAIRGLRVSLDATA